ncbi:glycosyltransferase family 2 protein [Ferrimicrobium sp.]|uniref:glycosyltransferase family 2 protein n=1 Tax=Ferrimicrobium sp. TaxID=2926050 RepID=UPI0026245CD9|nr:glycosyltransferase family 2 protein [Ferrimicrobium sp.]MCL5972883.1 glycosyltransferase family 2 protein [Actinomycetota bacterium]
MLGGKKVIVVVPAYNAEGTIERTLAEIDRSVVDEVIIVDDAGRDRTSELAQVRGDSVITHTANRGYGANQRTCYGEALRRGADIVVMVHADYQYSPRLIPALAGLIASGHYDVALGSRILGNGARTGGMPWWRYVANRALTALENALVGQKLSEYHTGLRAWSREILDALPLAELSDDFVFDSQTLALAILAGANIGEISCPTRYMEEASSINFRRSIRYGLGVVRVSLACRRALRGRPRGVFRSVSMLDVPRSVDQHRHVGIAPAPPLRTIETGDQSGI